MKIGLQTWGTAGDFFPFLALANGLTKAGHQVTLAYTSIDGTDYTNHPLAAEIELVKADGSRDVPKGLNPYAIKAKPGSFKEYSKLLQTFFDPLTEAMFDASEKLCRENDFVIGHAVCHTLLTASEKFNCPRVSLVLTPIVVRSKYTSPIGIDLGPLLNSFLWSVGGAVATARWFSAGKKLRKQQGLPSVKSLQKQLFTSDILTIVAASPVLTSKPKDWSANTHLTGFLNLPIESSNWEMPEDLKAFLNNGEPPVYMTFGSCMQFDTEESTKILIDAAKRSGKRFIIQSDWKKIASPSDSNIYCIGKTPHSEVFPKCSLIVHHGGAGTTQASILAGKPSVVVAHGFDQMYWGQQLNQTGIGGKVLERRSLTASGLASEIESMLLSEAKSKKASELGQRMKNENGVENAVKLISNITIK